MHFSEIFFSGISLQKFVKKAQNEPRGTFFRLEAIASHFLHIFSNLKTLIKSWSQGGALQPLQSTRLVVIGFYPEIE